MARIKVGVVGLGRMGLAIGLRLRNADYDVVGYDPNEAAQQAAYLCGIACSVSLHELVQQCSVVWMMIPAGTLVDDALEQMVPVLRHNHIVIDGGNSFFKDSIRRSHSLAQCGITFLDCGTSGGLHGKDNGFSLMIGGEYTAYQKIESIFETIAAPSGYLYCGPSGAGHYVKMVHNGVEYALLQAYAEGFHLLKEGSIKDLDLEKIAHVWNNGSIIRSWILELAEQIFKNDQTLENISGAIGENLTGKWTTDEAHDAQVPVKLIEEALAIRAWSRQSGGNYGTKVVALLRQAFGGHSVQKVSK